MPILMEDTVTPNINKNDYNFSFTQKKKETTKRTTMECLYFSHHAEQYEHATTTEKCAPLVCVPA